VKQSKYAQQNILVLMQVTDPTRAQIALLDGAMLPQKGKKFISKYSISKYSKAMACSNSDSKHYPEC